MNHEIEIKFRVQSKDALMALEKRARKMFAGCELKQVQQTNFFFDTRDLAVRKSGIGIRLRQEDENFFFTLKGPSPSKKDSKSMNVTQRLEFETLISRKKANEILSGELNPISFIQQLELSDKKMRNTRDHLLELISKICSKKDLRLIGSFTNLRRIMPVSVIGHPMKLEFDSTQFSHASTQYEVELEIPSMDIFSAAEGFLTDLFLQCDQTPAYEKSKSERFYAGLAK